MLQHSATLETINDSGFFGYKNNKSTYNFDKKSDIIINSTNFFEIVDVNIILGYDDPDLLMKKMEIFEDTPVTVRYYVPRTYDDIQKKLLNPYFNSLSSYATICNYIDTKINKNKLLSDTAVQKKFSISNILSRIVGSYNDLNCYLQP